MRSPAPCFSDVDEGLAIDVAKHGVVLARVSGKVVDISVGGIDIFPSVIIEVDKANAPAGECARERRGERDLHSDPTVRKVLIYRLGSLGDMVVSLPCLHLIERAFPNSERILLTNFPVQAKAPAAADVLGASGLVHGYMRYTVGVRSPRALLRLALEIRGLNPDVIVYLMPPRSPRAVRRDKLFFRWAVASGALSAFLPRTIPPGP